MKRDFKPGIDSAQTEYLQSLAVKRTVKSLSQARKRAQVLCCVEIRLRIRLAAWRWSKQWADSRGDYHIMSKMTVAPGRKCLRIGASRAPVAQLERASA